MLFKNIVTRFESNHKQLFLIDGLGALLSAFLLGVVLVKLERFFGIPANVLYLLAAIPCFFAVYDFYCYHKVNKNSGLYLKGIAIMNILYCCLSIGFAIYHYKSITYLGYIYIINEIIIVLTIAKIELKVASKPVSKKASF